MYLPERMALELRFPEAPDCYWNIDTDTSCLYLDFGTLPLEKMLPLRQLTHPDDTSCDSWTPVVRSVASAIGKHLKEKYGITFIIMPCADYAIQIVYVSGDPKIQDVATGIVSFLQRHARLVCAEAL